MSNARVVCMSMMHPHRNRAMHLAMPRTDGRTYGDAWLMLAVNPDDPNARAHVRGFARFDEATDATTSVVGAVSEHDGDLRWPAVRTGERDPIPSLTRRAVWRRDGGTCKECGFVGDAVRMELDHIVPWSAGGADTSDNLRVLCGPCNQRRGNLNDGAHILRRYLPVTWWCIDCWRCDWREDAAQRVYRPVEAGDDRKYPRIDPQRDRLSTAYCATCDSTSYTTVTL